MDDYDHDQYASLDELTEMCGKNSKNSILQTLRRKGLIGFTEKKWKKRVVARWLLSMLIECIEGEITVEDFAFWYEQSLSCDTIVEKGDDYAEYLMSCDTENERNPHMTSHDSRMTSRDII